MLTIYKTEISTKICFTIYMRDTKMKVKIIQEITDFFLVNLKIGKLRIAEQ